MASSLRSFGSSNATCTIRWYFVTRARTYGWTCTIRWYFVTRARTYCWSFPFNNDLKIIFKIWSRCAIINISNMFSVLELNLYWSPCYLCGRNGTLGRVENCCGLCLIVGLNIGLITFAAPLRKFLKNRVTPNPNWASAPGNGWITSDISTNKIEANSKPMPIAGFELTFLHCIMRKQWPCI